MSLDQALMLNYVRSLILMLASPIIPGVANGGFGLEPYPPVKATMPDP